MRVSDGSPRQPKGKRLGLYGGVIGTLELLRVIGFLGAVVWGIALSDLDGILGLITFITSGLTIYVSTTTCIAIIDLLGRIEQNTRHLQDINYGEYDY